ncbi:MAG TPA: LysR family transcriptional regulator [Candidatus Hydrogenedentes bacterium]|nr:LysR family transcriptional regulator [Candidatus Hydrogenedentota bacterium]
MNDYSGTNRRELEPKFKLWISSQDAQGVFGDGKWRLLKTIQQTGSLKAAAERLGISYRKAWGDLQKAEGCLGIKFMERHRGGVGGGETRLTPAGEAWVKAYARLRTKVADVVAREFQKEIARLCK